MKATYITLILFGLETFLYPIPGTRNRNLGKVVFQEWIQVQKVTVAQKWTQVHSQK